MIFRVQNIDVIFKTCILFLSIASFCDCLSLSFKFNILPAVNKQVTNSDAQPDYEATEKQSLHPRETRATNANGNTLDGQPVKSCRQKRQAEPQPGFVAAANITGELHIQGGSSVLNFQLNNLQLGLYNGDWQVGKPPEQRKWLWVWKLV